MNLLEVAAEVEALEVEGFGVGAIDCELRISKLVSCTQKLSQKTVIRDSDVFLGLWLDTANGQVEDGAIQGEKTLVVETVVTANFRRGDWRQVEDSKICYGSCNIIEL